VPLSDQDIQALRDLFGADADALVGLGARAADTLRSGLEGVVARAGDVQAQAITLAEYPELAAAFADTTHLGLELRVALPDGNTAPLAVLVPTADAGGAFMLDMSPEQMADETFAAAQLEIVAAGVRELLDLGGLSLFVGALAGAEATLVAARLDDIATTLATVEAAAEGMPAVRVDATVTFGDEGDTRFTAVLPAGLLVRLVGKLAEDAPAPAAAVPEPFDLPAFGDADALDASFDTPVPLASNVSPLRPDIAPPPPPSMFAADDVPVHPVRFPPLGAALNVTPASQQFDLIMDVPLRVTVELGRSSMTVDEVLALGPGSVIELNKLAGEPVDILVNDRLIAHGEVVVVDENFGVRVTEIVSPRARANAAAR
jgi:flagellar motor switch protein FliN